MSVVTLIGIDLGPVRAIHRTASTKRRLSAALRPRPLTCLRMQSFIKGRAAECFGRFFL